MADKKISQLPQGVLTSESIFPIVALGITSQVSFEDIQNAIGGSSFIEKTKVEIDSMISGSTLIPNSIYKISGVHPSLYDDGNTEGTTVFLKALSANELSVDGYGIFYNPKYNKEVDNRGIWENNVYSFEEGAPYQGFAFNVVNVGQSSNPINNLSSVFVKNNDHFYIGNTDYNVIYDLNLGSNTTSIYATGFTTNMVITSTNKIYYANGNGSVWVIGPSGGASSQLFSLSGFNTTNLVVDSNDNVYVGVNYGIYKIDSTNDSFSLFASVGVFLNQIAVTSSDEILVTATNGMYMVDQGGSVSSYSSLVGSWIDVDANDNAYVYNNTNSNIYQVDTLGNYNEIGNLGLVAKLKVTSTGHVYMRGYNYMNAIIDGTMYQIPTDGSPIVDILVDANDVAYMLRQNHVERIDETTGDLPSNFYDDEFIIGDNGSYGKLIGPFSDHKILQISGDIENATGITGTSSQAQIHVNNLETTGYSIGDKAIWGGYSWTNLNGNVGFAPSIYELTSEEWSKDQYSSINYNQVIDPIEYDYANDLIIARNEPKSGNKIKAISSTYFDLSGNNLVPINSFQFGNPYDYDLGYGIRDIVVEDGYFDNINFMGINQENIHLAPQARQAYMTYRRFSYQGNIEFGAYARQENILLGYESYQDTVTFKTYSSQNSINIYHNGYQSYLVFDENSTQGNIEMNRNAYQETIKFDINSYQYNLTFDEGAGQYNIIFGKSVNQQVINFDKNAYQSNITFDINATQNNINFGVNSYQENLTFGKSSYQNTINLRNNSYQDGLVFGEQSYQSDITINNGYQRYIVFGNGSYQQTLRFSGGTHQQRISFGTNSSQNNIIFDTNSSQDDISFKDSCSQYTITLGENSYQQNLTFDTNSSQEYITINDNSYQGNLNFGFSSSQQNITLGNNCYQTYIDFGMSSNQYGINFNDGAYQTALVFGMYTNQANITLPNDFAQQYVTFEMGSQLNGIDFSSSTLMGTYFNKVIYKRPDSSMKLRYYNDNDVLVIADVNY